MRASLAPATGRPACPLRMRRRHDTAALRAHRGTLCRRRLPIGPCLPGCKRDVAGAPRRALRDDSLAQVNGS